MERGLPVPRADIPRSVRHPDVLVGSRDRPQRFDFIKSDMRQFTYGVRAYNYHVAKNDSPRDDVLPFVYRTIYAINYIELCSVRTHRRIGEIAE